MSMGPHQLPLPAGARVSPPTRRAVVDRWAAPDPATLVLDPWAAPIGLAVATSAVSPWPAPAPSMRIRWMASPAALHPAPGLFLPSPSADAAQSTDRALATLRAIADDSAAARAPVFAAPDPSERIADDGSSAWSQIRWRVIALASAAGAAVGAGATLLITSL